MHGIRKEDVYKTPEEKEAYTLKLSKGFKLLDSFVSSVRNSDDETSDSSIFNDESEADRMFALSTDIIDFMPEFYPSWHYRKNYFLRHRSDREHLKTLLFSELNMLMSILKNSPKSFAVWQHRLWVLTMLFSLRPDGLIDLLNKELSLCMLLFNKDGRNFHGWGHVNYVRHYLKLLESDISSDNDSPTDRLCYSEFSKLIDKDFSNSSAWYHRSHLSETQGSLASELKVIREGIYTDPNDQCVWEHFDWLLYRRNALPYYVVNCYYCSKSGSILFYFNEPVNLSPSESYIIAGTSKDSRYKLDGVWSPIDSSPVISKIKNANLREYAWRFKLSYPVNQDALMHASPFIVVTMKRGSIDSFYSRLRSMPKCNVDDNNLNSHENVPHLLGLRYSMELHQNNEFQIDLASLKSFRSRMDTLYGWDETTDLLRNPILLPGTKRIVSIGQGVNELVLEDQLTMLKELDTLDSSKYLRLALTKISKYIGFYEKSTELSGYLGYGTNMHPTICSVLKSYDAVMQNLDSSNNSSYADLSNLGISNLPYRILQPHVMFESINLKGNLLSDTSLVDFGLCMLLNLRSVDLSENQFLHLSKVLESLRNLPFLSRIDLSGNPLTREVITGTTHIPLELSEIDISGSPLAEYLVEDAGITDSTTSEPLPCASIIGFKIAKLCTNEHSEGSTVLTDKSTAAVNRILLTREAN